MKRQLELVTPVPDENSRKNAIIQYLVYIGALVLRVNSGAAAGQYQDKQGRIKKRFYQFCHWYAKGISYDEGKAGVSDILAILPPWVSALGRLLFVVVECKVPGNAPTEAQRRFMAEVEARGGIALVASSVEDVQRALEDAGRRGVG